MSALRIHLRDRNLEMSEAWSRHFRGVEGVEVSCGDIFDVTCDAVVSPANSFGFMDGGIDLIYSQHLGWDVSERLREVLRRDHDGELPVGEAVLIETYHADVPRLVSAPTMRVPADVSDTVNAYLAFRAALRVVLQHNARSEQKIGSLLCPGLGTAFGRMPHERCAAQMHEAYRVVVLGQTPAPINLGQAVEAHHGLLR